jgi:hypothetical protein
MMPALAKNAVFTPIPVQWSEAEFNQFILPYLSIVGPENSKQLKRLTFVEGRSFFNSRFSWMSGGFETGIVKTRPD